MRNERLLGELSLRNARRIYASGSDYRAVQIDRHGAQHGLIVLAGVVDFVARHFSGQTVVVEDVAAQIQASFSSRLPYHYGFKLHFYTQDALLVLVATDRADLSRKGPRFYYTIFSS